MKPYYDREGITIYCGDCLEVMPQLDITVDAIIADNPYGTTACSWDSVIPLEPMWAEYKRLIKRNGAVVLFGSQPFTSMLVMSNLEWFKDEWVWDKVAKTNVMNAKNRPLKQHENLLVFSPGTTANRSNNKMTYNPQGVLPGNRFCWQTKNNGGEAMNPRRKSHVLGAYYMQGSDYPSSIIKVSNADHSNPLHPTQKPLKLLRYLARTYTNPGELVLDNAIGSGTTLVAARAEGRRAIGIDIDEHWCKVAVERLSNEKTYSLPNGKTYKQVSFLPDEN